MISMKESSLNSLEKGKYSDGRWSSHIPLIEICGRRRVLIENHCGILSYGTEEIRINGSLDVIRVCGKELRIRKVCREKLVISGVIDTIDFRGSL